MTPELKLKKYKNTNNIKTEILNYRVTEMQFTATQKCKLQKYKKNTAIQIYKLQKY